MRQAIVRVDPDPGRTMSPGEFADRMARLGTAVYRRSDDGELELIVDSLSSDDARQRATTACTEVFGTAPEVGAVTFLSRGTDADALGVLDAFGVRARIDRAEENGDEIATFTVAAADRGRVPESRLHTALEAALNCEVRIVFA